MVDLYHHLIGDAETMRLVNTEIEALILGEADKLAAPMPFRNFVAQALLGVSKEEHEAFFAKMLGDIDEPTAPFGLTDVLGDGSNIVEARREIDADLARRLRQSARKMGLSAAALHHLAWGLVLGRLTGREEVVFGTVLFGRMAGTEAADQILGMAINTLPSGSIWGALASRTRCAIPSGHSLN